MARPSFVSLTPGYRFLWGTLSIRPERRPAALAMARQIHSCKARYRAVEVATGVPWYVVGLIHAMEAALSWSTHLHNGDPLSARTINAPKGRPETGSAPFTWEESAIDALDHDGLDDVRDWSIERICYELESYNGWGYRRYHADVLSPYLWSFSAHYSRGKYAADGVWDQELESEQCGAMVLLRCLIDLGAVEGVASETPLQTLDPPPNTKPAAPVAAFELRAVQQRLADLGYYNGIVDGITGPKTTGALAAFQQASGIRVDGVYGPQTKGALADDNAPRVTPTTERLTATAKDLRQMGSGTIKAADQVSLGAKVLAGLGVCGLGQNTGVADWAKGAVDQVNAIRPLVDGLGELLHWATSNWPLLAVGAGLTGVYYASQIIRRRVEQFRASANV